MWKGMRSPFKKVRSEKISMPSPQPLSEAAVLKAKWLPADGGALVCTLERRKLAVNAFTE